MVTYHIRNMLGMLRMVVSNLEKPKKTLIIRDVFKTQSNIKDEVFAKTVNPANISTSDQCCFHVLDQR